MLFVKPACFLALPTYGPEGVISNGLLKPSKEFRVRSKRISSSFLIHNFNILWCAFLNEKPRADYFAMLHDDIAPEEHWIDILHREMEKVNADIISCVVPLKGAGEQTSTAVEKEEDIARISFSDLRKLPQTFTNADVAGSLLLNTGCWLARAGDWCEKFPGFCATSHIYKNKETGAFEPLALAEDWNFSVWAKKEGLKLAATTAVKLAHWGAHGWSIPPRAS